MNDLPVARHEHLGYLRWEIAVYPTGDRWHKWNAKICDVGRVVSSPLAHPPPATGMFSDYLYGDPFGARTAAGALRKAMREVRRCDAIREKTEALWAAL